MDKKDFTKATAAQGRPKVNITPDMMRSFKTLTCDCGNQLFTPGVVIKKISAIVSPSGQEELYPMEVLICTECGKVPNELNTLGMLPEGVLALKDEKKVPLDFGTTNPITSTFSTPSPLKVVRRNDEDERTKDELS